MGIVLSDILGNFIEIQRIMQDENFPILGVLSESKIEFLTGGS